jgi:hypothetical protein
MADRAITTAVLCRLSVINSHQTEDYIIATKRQ